MEKSIYIKSVKKCLDWINSQMTTFNDGYNGIYERIRINENIRTNWVRPDCNAEVARVISLYEKATGDSCYSNLNKNTINWLLRAQDNDELSAWYGSSPFYLTDGYIKADHPFGTLGGNSLFQNDNGKTLICLIDIYRTTGDKRLLESAIKLADYWVGIQRPDGTYFRRDGKTAHFPKGPCFVMWLAVGLIMCHKETGNERYKKASYKSLEYISSKLKETGRMTTSYELEPTEDWRPVSSESAIAVYTFAKAYEETHDQQFLDELNKACQFVISLQHESGAILNCNESCDDKSLSLQNNKELCDLVYTEGFALMALISAWKATGNESHLEASKKLADFLIGIQCNNESPLWDGAWRGSFNVKTRKWEGRADQNNPADEGGEFSVYTGWCAAPIMYGLLMLTESM